jgi:hypothetical protein
MLKSMIIIFQIILISFFSNAFASDLNFFPSKIIKEMKKDLPKYLKQIPKNEGQLEQINKTITSTKYNDIYLLVEPTFSSSEIDILIKNNDIFILIETIDIISYIYNYKKSFSEWYINKIMSKINNNPSLYIKYILFLCSKSDGMYSEMLADPVLSLIEFHNQDFILALDESISEKVCSILKSGDEKKALKLLNASPYPKNKSLKLMTECLTTKY